MADIISLDENVLMALDFFAQNPPPSLDLEKFNLPFVVGSGNAYNTGLILFASKAALFADESNFKQLITAFEKAMESKLITQAVVISASGSKDSVWEIELAKKYGLTTTLLTTKGQSDGAKVADEVLVYKSIDEPYTYNTSTYMGMILSATKENPTEIKKYIEALEFPKNFDNYTSYSFVLPDNFGQICPMLDIKKDELYGPHLSLRAFPQGHARHAKFVHRTPEELVISIGEKNEFFGHPDHRWDIFPENMNFGLIMALTYYIIGKIQKSKPQFFKESIAEYVSDYGPKAYGSTTKPFELIVPGTATEKQA